MHTRLALALATTMLFGCATRWEPREPTRGVAYSQASNVARWRPQVSSPWTGRAPPDHGPEPGVVPRFHGRWIPGGAACLAELARQGVAHERLESLRGVETPVRVTGPIGGIGFVAGAGLPLHCDCRLVVALAWAAPDLQELGVRQVRFSGAYVNRTTRSGRPSRHALGLAIDLHAMSFGDQRQEVKRNFSRGLQDGCAQDAPPLNRVACRLRQLGLFKELLTPDHDRDHHDHFHLAVASPG
jgi:hypothetical protein